MFSARAFRSASSKVCRRFSGSGLICSIGIVTIARFFIELLLAFLKAQHQLPSEELQGLIWHLLTVHFMPDYVPARWPALYVSWSEAAEFCQTRGKRLPTEAEWEKAARGRDGNLFPWGSQKPVPGLAVFGQHNAHQIPLIEAVDSGEEGQSP